MKMQAKQPAWEALNKLNEFQREVLERVDPGIIERRLDEARFVDVTGSEDFKSFRDDAIQALGVHEQAALSAGEKYRSVAAGKFADRSSSTLENITQFDELGRRWKEFGDIQLSIEAGPLKRLEDSISKMREGPEKEEATEGLNEAREGLKDLMEDEEKDLAEYKNEADKIEK
jgi:hypothetical protein